MSINQLHVKKLPNKLQDITPSINNLFYQGDVSLINHPCIAIVGPRKHSFYGEAVTKAITTDLVAAGFCIVSGLAAGIDAIAHQAALNVNGNTIAVIANGLNIHYPKRNKKIAQQIAQKGLIISEYPQNTPPLKHHFPLRNRIISALAQAVLIIEAPLKSGALITAEYAFRQNRDVFAIPGSVFSDHTAGTHRLIKESKAQIVTSAQDIIEHLQSAEQLAIPYGQDCRQDLHPKSTQSIFHRLQQILNAQEQAVLDALRTRPLTLSDLSKIVNLSVTELSPILMELEIKKMIKRKPGSFYQSL